MKPSMFVVADHLYTVEFRRQIVEYVRAGRSPAELAKECDPSAQAIRNWVRQLDRDEGRRLDGLTTEERRELARLATTEKRSTR